MNRVLLVSFFTISFLSATTINVPDDYSTIQAAIDASNDGDTVLVAPGIYVENLVLEVEIVLASHAINDDLTDWMNNENIQNTKIIGNEPSDPKKGSCLQISYGSIEPLILGFTFQDGLGTSMGINDCGVYRTQMSGGAILAYQAYPTIMYNHFINNGTSQVGGGNAGGAAVANGGAISHYDTDDVEFDEDRSHSDQGATVDFSDMDAVRAYILENDQNTDGSNSTRDRPATMIIQNNYFANNSSGNGENFYSHGFDGDIDVSGSVFENIDCETNTVNEFVLQSIEDEADYIQDDISGNCIEENIFYVSSDDGDDSNIGTDETEPLKTIRHALTLMRDNADEVTTIYLAPGVYSNDRNGELFPIVIPDNVHLIGDEAENTELHANADADNEAAVMIIKEVDNVKVANLTLSGGYSEGHGCTGGGGLLLCANDMFNLNAQNGIYVEPSYPVIENVIIEDNHSHNGGGLGIFRVNGPVLNNVTIRNNNATAFGGGVFSYCSTIQMTNVTISENQNQGYGQGGGMMLAASSGTLDYMNISNNTANGSHGGGIWTNDAGGENSWADGWTMTNSVISGNSSDWFGGGIMFAWSHPTVINSTISDNTGNWGGGGVFGLNGGFTLRETTVRDNAAGGGGGGIYAWGPLNGISPPVIEDCIVTGNETGSNGGGIGLDEVAEAIITRTYVVENHAAQYFSGISVYVSDVSLNNLTISGGTSGGGGVIGISTGGHVDLTNSIVWNNSGENNFGSTDGDGSINITYSDIEGGFEGEGNIDADPLFTDASGGDYSITQDSPCKDAGTADTDGDGVDDITDYSGLAPDMGAFETTIAALEGFTLYPMETYVTLTWTPTTDDAFQYYFLERSTDVDFSENIEGNYLTNSYYEDNSLEFDIEYFYRVSYYANGQSEYSEVLSVTLEAVNVDDLQRLPTVYALHNNYPNPFNPVTNLTYDLPENETVSFIIYDLKGHKVRSLVNGKQSAGYHSIRWDATNDHGAAVSAGMYIYVIQAGNFTKTKKMVLLK